MTDGALKFGHVVSGTKETSVSGIVVCSYDIPMSTSYRIEAVCVINQIDSGSSCKTHRLIGIVGRELGSPYFVGEQFATDTEGSGASLYLDIVDNNLVVKTSIDGSGVLYKFSCNLFVYNTEQYIDGYSIDLDGSSDYVTMGDTFNFEYTDDFSLSFWFKTTDNEGYLVSKQTTDTTYRGYGVAINASGRLSFVLRNSSVSSNMIFAYSNNTGYDDDIWHHVVMTWAGSATPTSSGLNVYIDGVQDVLIVTVDLLSATIVSSSSVFCLGARNGTDWFTLGNIDEVSVYNKTLSSTEAIELYNSGIPTNLLNLSSSTNIVGYWRCGDEDAYPTLTDNKLREEYYSSIYPTIVDSKFSNDLNAVYPTIVDLSGNGYDGTMTDMSINDIVLDSPGGTFCKFSTTFDGVGDYITMGNVLDFDYNEPFSISFWINTTDSTATAEYIVSKLEGASNYRGYGLNLQSSGVIRLNFIYIDATNKLAVQNTTSINDGDWHHFVVTYDGSTVGAGVNFYVDSVSDTASIITDTLGSNTTINSASFNISSRTDGTFPFIGSLTDVTVYNKELSTTEISGIYNSGIPLDNRNLSSGEYIVGYWRLGNDVRFNGTMTTMAINDVVFDSPGGTYSKCSLLFDGSDDYVTHSDVLNFERTDAFSVSCWYKSTDDGGYFVSKRGGSTAFKGWATAIEASTSGRLAMWLTNTYTTNECHVYTTTTGWNDGEWHHAVFTYDGSSSTSGFAIYIDNDSKALTSVTNNLSNSIQTTFSLNLGGRTDSGGYGGNLVDPTVYNKELSAEEVTEIYNSGAPTDNRTLSSADNIVGYWRTGSTIRFDGTMTTMTADDFVVDTPAIEVVTGDSVYSTSFTSTSSEYVTAGDYLNFEYTDDFSISCWFKTTDTNGFFVAKQGIANTYRGYYLKVRTAGALEFGLSNDYTGGDMIQGGTTATGFNDGAWHHVIMTWTGSATPTISGVNVYVDNVAQTLTTYTDALTSTIIDTGNINFGTSNDGVLGYLDGNLDEIIIFNKVLSLFEISILYHGGKPLDISSSPYLKQDIVGYWRMGDGDTYPTLFDNKLNDDGYSGAYPTVVDFSGNGYDGTMTNMETVDIALDAPGGTYSKFSMLFDGSNEYITMGDVLGFERTDVFSFSSWFKTSTLTTAVLLSKEGDSTAYRGYNIQIHSTNHIIRVELISDFGATNYLRVSGSTAINDNSWHHMVVSYNGSSLASGVKIYIDGVLETLTEDYDNLTGTIITANSFYIGGRASSGSLVPFPGRISDVTVYDKELSLTEVGEIYNFGSPIDNRTLSSASNIAGYWRIGSSTRFDGTMTNMSSGNIVTDVP